MSDVRKSENSDAHDAKSRTTAHKVVKGKVWKVIKQYASFLQALWFKKLWRRKIGNSFIPEVGTTFSLESKWENGIGCPTAVKSSQQAVGLVDHDDKYFQKFFQSMYYPHLSVFFQ